MKIRTLSHADYPTGLSSIATPPKQLFYLGNISSELWKRPRVAIVGSRKASAYGTEVTKRLAYDLAAQGVVIVSGLAIGLDAAAHTGALEAGGTTIAVLPSGLDAIYPATNRPLAIRILKQNGALVTEYPEKTQAWKDNFLARNRIISALSDGVLVTEAAERSGSLNTASHALEQGRTVMAVPGNITSINSQGTNNLIKTGATPVVNAQDVLYALHLEAKDLRKEEVVAQNEEEHIILSLLKDGLQETDDLLKASKLETPVFNQTLTMLEITGKIRPLGGDSWIVT